MGIYQKANDLALRMNGKEGAEARMHALAISEALEPQLSALVAEQRRTNELLERLLSSR